MHSDKTVCCLKETQTVLKGEFYTCCLVSSCCHRISVGRVGFHLSKQAFSSLKAKGFEYRARRNSWQSPKLIPVPKTDASIAFYSGLVCLGFGVLVGFFFLFFLPVSLIGITIIVCRYFLSFLVPMNLSYVLWNFAEQGLNIAMFLKFSMLCYNLFNFDFFFVLFWHVLETYLQSLCGENRDVLFPQWSGTSFDCSWILL